MRIIMNIWDFVWVDERWKFFEFLEMQKYIVMDYCYGEAFWQTFGTLQCSKNLQKSTILDIVDIYFV